MMLGGAGAAGGPVRRKPHWSCIRGTAWLRANREEEEELQNRRHHHPWEVQKELRDRRVEAEEDHVVPFAVCSQRSMAREVSNCSV